MSEFDVAVINGTVITPDGAARRDVLIRGETIAAIEPSGPRRAATRVIDAEGRLVLPGGVDVHTHFLIGFMGQKSVYDFHTGSAAALRGGTTTIVDFALQRRGRTLMDGIKHRRVQADQRVVADYGLHLIVTDVNEASLAEIPAVIAAGVTSFKVYMVYEKEQLRVPDDALRTLLAAAGRAGILVGVHAENAEMIDRAIERCLAAGEHAPRFHALTRPPEAEAEAIRRAIRLAGEAKAPLYIFHLSAGDGLAAVEAAQARGQPVFAETCPHYLALTEAVYDRADAHHYVMSPPLRSAQDQAKLWQGLKTGSLAAVASDDASYSAEAKKASSFEAIANGVPGAEARLPVLFTLGVDSGRLSLSEFAEVWSGRPARLFGLAPRKGALIPGADADLVIVDTNRRERLTPSSHYGPIGYMPYDGMEVTGLPELTLRRGHIMVERGTFLGTEGSGQFLARQLPDTRLQPAR